VCEILHALTGCDTTSSFFGIGKKFMFKALKETPNQFSDLSRIECSDIDDSVDLSRKLISRLYDPKGKSKRCHIDLNKLRVKLATRGLMLGKDKVLCRTNSVQNKHNLYYKRIFLCMCIRGPAKNQTDIEDDDA
jgi:5-bromo-4-chloroindolyl phosphate hydrolysis protein